MRFYGKVFMLEFDKNRYKHDFDTALRDAYVGAVKAFVEAAAAKVPVLTGMSRGSLQPLADYAGAQLDLSEAHPRKGRNAETGASLTDFDANVWHWPEYRFNINIRTVQYHLWEQYESVLNKRLGREVFAGPWESFQAGRKAFKKYLDDHLKSSLPQLKKYLKRTEVKLDRGRRY